MAAVTAADSGPSAAATPGGPPRPRLLAVCGVGHPGGAELGLLLLLRRLAARGWSIALASPAGPLAQAARDQGWDWNALSSGPLAGGRRALPRALASWPRVRLLARGADVVYLNGTVSGRMLPALGGSHTVLHVHDMVTRVPRFWRAADVVLADSGAVAHGLADLPAHVVWCPVERDPPEIAAPWPSGGAPLIGFVGRIEPRKGPLDLVRAAPLIRAQLPSARIVIVGDDPFGSDPEYVARVNSPTDGVEHYGWVAGAAGLMHHLEVLVVPSHSEPFGTVAAEAMAAGTPVVATRVDGLPEVVPDGVGGVLVAPGDPGALAEGVLEALRRRTELSAGARGAARRFDADDYAERVRELIEP